MNIENDWIIDKGNGDTPLWQIISGNILRPIDLSYELWINYIYLHGNTISITESNGNLNLLPNGIGTIKLGRDLTLVTNLGKSAIIGQTVSTADGPNISYYGHTDLTFPFRNDANYDHDDVSINFDSYKDGVNFRSSDASNFQIIKWQNIFQINWASGVSLGSPITWNRGISLQTNGYVGIGIPTTASALLHVGHGDLRVDTDATYTGFLSYQTSLGHYWRHNIASDLTYFFAYDGSWRAGISSVDGTYTPSSDQRLKKDILEMGETLSKLMKIKSYNYKVKTDPDQKEKIGFIAQNIQPEFPQLIGTFKLKFDDPTIYYNLNYDGMITVNTKCIQELNIKLENALARITELETA